MVAFDEKISTYQRENEEVINVIARGSDEHLDFLSHVRNELDSLSVKLETLVTDLIEETNKFTDEEVVECIPGLLKLYSNSKSLVAILKRKRIDKDIQTSTKNYYMQVDNLREYIYDLDRIRLNEDDELDQILQEI